MNVLYRKDKLKELIDKIPTVTMEDPCNQTKTECVEIPTGVLEFFQHYNEKHKVVDGADFCDNE